MTLRRTCLTGHPVAHSRSPLIHNYWLRSLGLDGVYELKDLAPERFPGFLRELGQNGYIGCNVTVPHKEAAYRLVDRRDESAEAVGAVNTIWLEGGRRVGGNSDVHGFIANLDACAPGWDAPARRAVVLGAGGGACAAVYGLRRRGVAVCVVNRTLERAQLMAARLGAEARGFDALPELLRQADLLVNCTSLGLAGIGLQAAQQVIGAPNFGADAQQLHAFNGLQEGLEKLG